MRPHKPVDYDVPSGSMIPGSRLYRVYCHGCGERMRVCESDSGKPAWCEGCTLKPQTGGSSGPIDEDSGGYSANARMQMEDG